MSVAELRLSGRQGCGIVNVAATMAAALDMGRRRGKQMVVCSHGGAVAEEHGVGLAVRMQLVDWSVVWRRGLRGVV